MENNQVLTVRELAEYIRLHERYVATLDEYSEYMQFMSSGQWKFELASVDHYLQKRLMESNNEDLDLVISSGDHPMPLSCMTDEALIDLDFRADNRNKALSKLAKMASQIKAASSYEELYLELESREKILSTAMGNGIAVPHSRFPHQLMYRQPKLIFARSAAGVDFGAPDNKKVHLFFMPCAPTQYIHLRMMAQIAKLLHEPKLIEQLKSTTKKEDVLPIIRAFERRQLAPFNFNSKHAC